MIEETKNQKQAKTYLLYNTSNITTLKEEKNPNNCFFWHWGFALAGKTLYQVS
jgi:hypothetical protein